ncbi:hypothetical protein [Pseudanabaena phage PA-SR01]|nr:hypothetical protein [Pseudanabaena phage PA-SR01]
MLADLPEPQPEPFDFTVLNQRIKEVRRTTSSMSQQQLAKYFVENTILPILKTPDIYKMLCNEAFVEQFTGLLVGYITTSTNIIKPVNNIDE